MKGIHVFLKNRQKKSSETVARIVKKRLKPFDLIYLFFSIKGAIFFGKIPTFKTRELISVQTPKKKKKRRKF